MIGWLDVGVGVSGDLLLGAFVGAGVPLAVPAGAIARLELGITLRIEPVTRAGLAATRIHVRVPESRTVRRLPEIRRLLAPLDDDVRTRAVDVFERLARAEAAVHGVSVDDIHFHEVGALDSIADVVGVCAAAERLGLDRLVVSPLGVGRGRVRTEHGSLPVPVPAVLELVKGVAPVEAGRAPFEAATPTGAALLVALADDWGPLPSMVVERVGTGAARRDPDGLPNVVRLVAGTPVSPVPPGS